MTEQVLNLGRGTTVALPPGAKVTTIAPDTHQVVWHSAGERRPFTVTFIRETRAVTQWFRRAKSWQMLLNMLQSAETTPHVYIGGVATGEEAYSLAMMLEAHGIAARITATELNAGMLSLAQQGVYTRDSAEQAKTSGVLAPRAFESFLRPVGDRFQVAERIRDRVTFELADLRTATLPTADIVMLRNLWRHLGVVGAAHLAGEVFRALPPYGVLSIGGADGLADIDARAGLDAVLLHAGLLPVGVEDLYFRP